MVVYIHQGPYGVYGYFEIDNLQKLENYIARQNALSHFGLGDKKKFSMFKKVKTKSILEIDCNAIEPNFTEYEKSLIKLIKDCNYKESIRRINVITEYFKQNPKELQEASVYESLSDSVISDFKWDYCIQFDINGENYYVKSQQYEDLTKDKICWFDFKGYDIYKYYYNSEMPFEKIIVEHKVNHNN